VSARDLAATVLDLLVYPVDAAAMEYVARELDRDPKKKLWAGERYEAPGDEALKALDCRSEEYKTKFHEIYGALVTDTDVRMHMVGDTGVQNFYHVLEVMAALLKLAGRGDRVAS
jgi:hypothetical protein